jgi:UDP-glucose 4-epimerase
VTWNNKRVLITGGLGFIGSTLTHTLVDAGANVTIFDARLSEYGSNPTNIREIRDEVQVVEGDVREAKAVATLVQSSDVVFHLAAQLSRTVSNEQPDVDAGINCIGLLNVLSAASSCEDPPRVVFTSSQAVVGRPPTLPLDESTRAAPRDIYGVNKRAGELYCDVYTDTHDVPTVVSRLTNVYGPRAQLSNPNYGVIHNFIASALKDETLTVFEPGTMQRDFIHVDDVVTGLLELGRADSAIGERYILGTGRPTTIKWLAETIVDIAGSGAVELVPWPDEWDSIRVGDLYADPSSMKEQFGWEATTYLENGLRGTIEFYREYSTDYLK